MCYFWGYIYSLCSGACVVYSLYHGFLKFEREKSDFDSVPFVGVIYMYSLCSLSCVINSRDIYKLQLALYRCNLLFKKSWPLRRTDSLLGAVAPPD